MIPRCISRRGARGAAALLIASACGGDAGGPLPTAASPSSALAPSAVVSPRHQWLRDASVGLFLHWGMRTSPEYTDVAAWEARVTADGWSADYWVDEARKLHARYLVLASFHSVLGYVRTWPSRIPGSPATRRDFLGELIAAARAKGVKVLLYMTDDPSHHDETGFEYLDRAAYAAYAGDPSIDIRTRDGFGRFSYDNFVEVMERYPDLAGFWIDNDNAYWEQHGLYDRIRAQRPDWLLSNNNEDTPGFDTVSHEEKSGMTPRFDYPAATWTPLPRLTEADFKVAGGWWYGGTNPSVDYTLAIGRLVTCAGSSIKSLAAEGAMHGGRFPPNLEAFNTFMDGYLARIAESIEGTEGGGYMFGGLAPGFLNDNAFAVTTVSRSDPDLHYVHILARGSAGAQVRLRDNGYRVKDVADLRSGAPLAFTQQGGTLSIDGITSWDTYDTVLRVRTAGREGVYAPSSLAATATPTRAGFPATNLVDGDFTTYWDNNGQLPVSIRLDLGAKKRVVGLALNQREWSVSYARSASEDSARIKDYSVYLSDDDNGWGDAVKTGTLRSARGVQFIDFEAREARYLRLDVATTWAAASATNYARRLRIDEMSVLAGYATPAR
jgi:alpha-L-fucosidase